MASTMKCEFVVTPGYRRWAVMKRQAVNIIEQIASEMETYYAQRSERWQDSERGEAFLEAIEMTEDAAAVLRELEA
jgi:hypothetical protein